MEVRKPDPPREFVAGPGIDSAIRHCADVTLTPGEQITVLTETGKQWDIVRTGWGFYGTPSLDSRLRDQKLRACLVETSAGKRFIWIVDAHCVDELRAYMRNIGVCRFAWLDEIPLTDCDAEPADTPPQAVEP